MTSTKTQTEIPADDEILEGAVFTVKQTRYLKIVVIVMGIMLVFGFIGLAIAVMSKAGQKKQAKNIRPPVASAGSGTAGPLAVMNPVSPENRVPGQNIILPRGTVLKSYKISGNRLVLHVSEKKQDQLIIFDLITGATLSRIRLPYLLQKPQ